VVGVVDCEPLRDRSDEDLLSAVGDANEVEPVVERDLACSGDPPCVKGVWFWVLTGGSPRPCRGWVASERRKELGVGDGLGSAIGEADTPGISFRLQSQGQSGPGNAYVVQMAAETDASAAGDTAGEWLGRLRGWWRSRRCV
jgi:hypothetical protein